MSLVTIRPASADDVAALADIAIASYRAAFAPIIGEPGLAAFSREAFMTRFAGEWPFISAAVDASGRICGFAEVREGVLDMMFVAPGATGSGAGALLLADAQARGATRLECFAANDGARRFYERHGWRLTRVYSRSFAGARHDFTEYTRPKS